MAESIPPPYTHWGLPTASKRALCLHGLASSSQVWGPIARALVEKGYSVTAPDLLGHGLSPTSENYSLKTFADAVLSLTSSSPPYDLVIGHSLGALVALHLIPHLQVSGKLQVVLIDPAFNLANGTVDMLWKSTAKVIANDKSAEEFVAEKGYTEADATWKVLGRSLCSAPVVDGVFKDNIPWSYMSLLPPASPTLRISILGADPAVWAYLTPADVAALKRERPDIRTRVIKGSSHSILQEVPYRNIIVEEALSL